jgi:hypothetical protein
MTDDCCSNGGGRRLPLFVCSYTRVGFFLTREREIICGEAPCRQIAPLIEWELPELKYVLCDRRIGCSRFLSTKNGYINAFAVCAYL